MKRTAPLFAAIMCAAPAARAAQPETTPAPTPMPPPSATTAPPEPVPAAPPAASPESASPAAPAEPPRKKHKVYGSNPDDIGERATTWDLNIEGAYGRAFGDVDKPAGFGRIRGGILRIREPFFYALGATYEISPFTLATFGVQGEVMHLSSGFWAQLGAMLDIQPKPGAMASLGWSILGAEVQVRSFDRFNIGTCVAVFAKLRIPISVISWGLRSHDE